jgi:UPF0271 protein
MGYDPMGAQMEQFIVPAVIDEVRDRSARLRISTAVDIGILKVALPSKESKDKVITQSTRLGDIDSVSDTDIDVLALAFDLISTGKKCFLVTDDYAVQNVANQLGIPFKTLATKGIKYQFLWRLYCPACGRFYPPDLMENVCPVCGTLLKRRVAKKKMIREI